MAGVYIFYGILFCHMALVTGQNATDAKKLWTDLFNDYNKKIRPIVNQSETVNVKVSLFLLAIHGLDEVSEVLKTTGYLRIEWNDHFLKWDFIDYGEIDFFTLPQDDVWKPDVALKNSFKDHKDLGVPSLNVRVDSSGLVTWHPFQVFESTCSMNIEHFPFDVQTCILTFLAWSYWPNEVNITSEAEGLFLDYFQPSATWDIVNTSWRSENVMENAVIHFTVKIKRKPLYVIISVILPIAFLAVLNIFVFVLPCDSGERSGYAVTVFLALAVFLTIVSETLPANSDTVAVLSIYLIIQTAQSTTITLIALSMLRMNSLTSETKVPACVIAMLRLSARLRCSNKRSNTVRDDVNQIKQTNDNSVERVSVNGAYAEDEHNAQWGPTVPINIEGPELQYTWKHVINLLDVVCLVFFSAVCIISTFLCFGISMTIDQ